MKSIKSILAIILVTSLVVLDLILGPFRKDTQLHTITTSQLEEATNVSELSTAEFVHNGICEQYSDGNPKYVRCYISYDANVKVGINMKDIQFEIDEEKKTITPILPPIRINIATLNENTISYIPKNPNIPLKEVVTLCKEDALKEANESQKLKETAKENLQSVIEGLLSPLLDNSEYSILWKK